MKDFYNLVAQIKNPKDIEKLFCEIFTINEIKTLSKRWRILEMLVKNHTQREISDELGVSLCKVTRGSKILKDKNAIVTKFLIKEK